MRRYVLWLFGWICVFSISQLGASELDKNSERPALFDRIKTAPASSKDLTPYYSVNKDGDGLGEELPSSIIYFKKGSKEYSTSMTVTDISLCKRPIESKICQAFIKTITKTSPPLGTDISNTRIGGADYVTVFLTTINPVELSGVDNAMAFISIDTQDPPLGDIVIYIYAKKGTNLIQLTTHVEECPAHLKPNESDISFYKRCVSKKIIADANAEANRLIKLFKLNN